MDSRKKHGGARSGAGRKLDPEKKHRGREANVHTLFLAGDVAMIAVDAIRSGNEDNAKVLIDFFVFKRHRKEARTMLGEVADILKAHPDLEKDPKFALRDDSPLSPSEEKRSEARIRAAGLIREVENLMNPNRVSEAVTRAISGVEPVVDGKTEEKEEIRQSKIDLVKRAAGTERHYWNWVKDLRHKNLNSTLTEKDLEPPDEEQAKQIAAEYTPSSGKKK